MKGFIFKILIYLTVIYFLIYYYRLALPYFEYEVNKEYIEKNLCVNKNKPWMKCHGKCYLKKQIKKASEKEKKSNPFVITENTLLFFFPQIDLLNIIDLKSKKENSLQYINLYKYLFILKIFKPPKLFILK